jgi:predicted aspartyl protease
MRSRITISTTAIVENLFDCFCAEQNEIGWSAIRRYIASHAVIDTRATYLCLPTDVIRKLGLKHVGCRRCDIGWNPFANIYEAVRLTIQDRFGSMDVMELPNEWPVTIGDTAILTLGLIVDPLTGKLVDNPEFPHGWMFELCGVAS